MLSRFAALFLFIFAVALIQSTAQYPLPAMKTFQEADFNMTFIYPAELVPAKAGVTAPSTYRLPTPKPATPRCVQTPLSVGSDSAGNTALVFSIIDDSCPTILRDAQKLGIFTQAQILRQLKSYGTVTITLPARSYTFDGRPAVVVLASASPDTSQPAGLHLPTYAAKVCMFAHVTAYTFGKIPRDLTAANSVICFDFTTHQQDQLTPLLDLPVVFDDLTPRSLVPATILR